MAENLVQIGVLAERVQLGVQTLRYYERRGLLKPKAIKQSGYRLYGDQAFRTLIFIRNAKQLGFSLNEVGQLLELRGTGEMACQEVVDKAKSRLTDVQTRIKILKDIEKSIKGLIRRCESRENTTNCPILSGMEKT